MKTAIIGCGAIGLKRAAAMGRHELLYAADTDISRAQHMCLLKKQGKAVDNWTEIITDPALELVIVSTTNNMLAPVAVSALQNNKHVLIEKPGGRNPKELAEVIKAQEISQAFAKVGFNHRFHPALIKARNIVRSKEIGEIMFIRGRYGHGGRVGYEKEWRFDPELSGGGELLDQGIHLIDLSRWMFDSEFTQIHGHAGAYFWDTALEDNGFMQLQTSEGQTAWLHVSATEWKNMFSMEIYARTGKLQIDGLGGSYGLERLTYYKMLPQMGPPETTAWEYPFPDNSWELELEYFAECIKRGVLPEGNIYDAKQAIDVVFKIYEGGRSE
jgi:predicted dehydrogenase